MKLTLNSKEGLQYDGIAVPDYDCFKHFSFLRLRSISLPYAKSAWLSQKLIKSVVP